MEKLWSIEIENRKKTFNENFIDKNNELSSLRGNYRTNKEIFDDIEFVSVYRDGFAFLLTYGLTSLVFYFIFEWFWLLYIFLFLLFARLTLQSIRFIIAENKESKYNKILNDIKYRVKNQEEVLKNINEKEVDNRKKDLFENLDVNKDGTIDVIQHKNEFIQLLKLHQVKILEFEKKENRNFIQQFVQLSKFQNEKKDNLQGLFSRTKDFSEIKDIEVFQNYLLDQIHFYNLIQLNAVQMLTSFINNDRITFYEIYDFFDNQGVFMSYHQRSHLILLGEINSNIESLVEEIRELNSKMDDLNDTITKLVKLTEENIAISESLSTELSKIDSSINVGNTINLINTYQNYRTNKLLR
jgi:hypothetical protein